MKNIKTKMVMLLGFTLWGVNINAESSPNTFYKDESYKELLNTKNILTLEPSPDKRHFLLIYATPYVFESQQGTTSQWHAVTLVKNDYKSEKSHTVKFPDNRKFDLVKWIPESQNISYLGKGDKYTSFWITPCHEFKPKKVLELNQDITYYWWSPDGKKVIVLIEKSPSSSPFKIVYGEHKMILATLYSMEIDAEGQLVRSSSFDVSYKSSLFLSWVSGNDKVVISYDEREPLPVNQIALIDLKTKERRILTQEEEMSLPIAVSPDGRWVAYSTTNFPGKMLNPIPLYQMDASRVCLIDLQNGHKRYLAPTPNENPDLMGWKKDGKSVFVTDREGNTDQIYEISLDATKATKFTQGEQSLRIARLNSAGDMISYSAQDFKTPTEGYTTPVDHFHPKKVTSLSTSNLLNDDLAIEKIKWKSKDKKFDLEGVVIYPGSSLKGKALFPLITLLTDYHTLSPLIYLGNLTSYPISHLRLLKKGYALFIPTRRGENGYGVEFRQAIYKELGKGDFDDIMAGIDAVIEGRKVDPHQLVLWGWRYGGYLSAWALTQTDRFKTIIVGQGIANLISQIGTMTSPDFLEAVLGEPFWKDFNLWDQKSPISHVKNMQTPTLLQYVTPGKTVLSSQGDELFFPLKTEDMLCDMYRYESSGDEIFDSHMTLLGIQDLENWLEGYVRTASNATTKK